jgi:hypothetical protein
MYEIDMKEINFFLFISFTSKLFLSSAILKTKDGRQMREKLELLRITFILLTKSIMKFVQVKEEFPFQKAFLNYCQRENGLTLVILVEIR